jgi:hypothetical protein
MTFLPIVDRELRVRARQKSTHRIRLIGAVLASGLVALMLLASAFGRGVGRFGGFVFVALAWLAFLYALLEGARNTADCLSEEKRAGTLGLLFLTDLKGYDVVLGKLIATSLNSFYSLLAIFPPLALPLLLGGVTAGEFWRLVLVLLNTLFFSVTAGLVNSAVTRDEFKARGGALAIILVIAAGPLLPAALSAALPASIAPQVTSALAGSVLSLASPVTGLRSLFDAAYQAAPRHYWYSLLIIHSLSWLFLTAASCLLPRAWQDRPVMPSHPWFQRFRSRKNTLTPEVRRRVQDRQMTPNPVLWLAVRRGGLQPYLWAGIAILASAAIAAWLISRGAPPVLFGIFCGAWGVHLLLTILVASQACLFFAQARDSGALELLLCTPVTVNQIVEGHINGLKQRFLGPALTLVGVELLIVIGQMLLVSTRDRLSLDAYVLLPTAAGALIYLFLTDLAAAGWFGLWMGLRSKNSGQALTRTVLLVLIAPIISVACCSSVGLLIILFKNVVLITYAMDQLRRNFRAQVTQRFAADQAAALQPVRLAAIGPGERPPVITD